MLFNSPEFIFIFLPIVVGGFYILRATSFTAAFYWLLVLSLVFYGWSVPWFLFIIVGSIVCNYIFAILIARTGPARQRWLTAALAIAANLALLGYFKYAAFINNNVGWLLGGADAGVAHLTLPLGISFFTFQAIAYLVEVYRGQPPERRFSHYALLIGFFPHSIAGPIVHPNDVLPQLNAGQMRFRWSNLAVGLTFFAVGLFKKVMFADTAAQFSTPVFTAFAAHHDVTMAEAWIGALGYTLQIYFDFSAYSDMAIGFARMFGIRFPLNFFSPYKATSVIEFWRRWHISLSRWLRDYLYIALGGNRKGPARRYANLMITMLLGGLWHGASWTFVIWGGLHGLYLVINHFWRTFTGTYLPGLRSTAMSRTLAAVVTFLAVVVAWVFFRADTAEAAIRMLGVMFGFSGIVVPESLARGPFVHLAKFLPLRYGGMFGHGYIDVSRLYLIPMMSFVVWLLPNCAELVSRYRPVATPGFLEGARRRRLLWRPTPLWAVFAAALFLISVVNLGTVSEFIYFNF